MPLGPDGLRRQYAASCAVSSSTPIYLSCNTLKTQTPTNQYGRLVAASSGCLFGQHLVQFLFRSMCPALPSRNLDRTAARVGLYRHQRVATLFGNQRPVRATPVVTRAKLFQTLPAMGRIVVQPPIDLFGDQSARGGYAQEWLPKLSGWDSHSPLASSPSRPDGRVSKFTLLSNDASISSSCDSHRER